jgi:hypothetical protein
MSSLKAECYQQHSQTYRIKVAELSRKTQSTALQDSYYSYRINIIVG